MQAESVVDYDVKATRCGSKREDPKGRSGVSCCSDVSKAKVSSFWKRRAEDGSTASRRRKGKEDVRYVVSVVWR